MVIKLSTTRYSKDSILVIQLDNKKAKGYAKVNNFYSSF